MGYNLKGMSAEELNTLIQNAQRELKGRKFSLSKEKVKDLRNLHIGDEGISDEVMIQTVRDNVLSYLSSGKSLYSSGRYDEAMLEFEKILAIDPYHVEAKNYHKRAIAKNKAIDNLDTYGPDLTEQETEDKKNKDVEFREEISVIKNLLATSTKQSISEVKDEIDGLKASFPERKYLREILLLEKKYYDYYFKLEEEKEKVEIKKSGDILRSAENAYTGRGSTKYLNIPSIPKKEKEKETDPKLVTMIKEMFRKRGKK